MYRSDIIKNKTVFISYSNHDENLANAVCDRLEKESIRCWIAPRDITPGADYADSIVNGIQLCKIMIVIFTSHANESKFVKKEVERAVSKGIIIIPVRFENVMPTNAMELFLSSAHWLDAMTPPLDNHLHKLAKTVKDLLGIQGEEGGDDAGGNSEGESGGSSKEIPPVNWQKIVFGAGISAVAVIILYLSFFRQPPPVASCKGWECDGTYMASADTSVSLFNKTIALKKFDTLIVSDKTVTIKPFSSVDPFAVSLRDALLRVADISADDEGRKQLADSVWSQYFYDTASISLYDSKDNFYQHPGTPANYWQRGEGRVFLSELIKLKFVTDITILHIIKDPLSNKISQMDICENKYH